MLAHEISGLLVALLVSAPLAAEPHLVQDLNRGPSLEAVEASTGAPFGVWEGASLLPAADPAHGSELWRTDGTPAGTRRLTDVCPGRCDAYPGPPGTFRGRLYFAAGDGVSGRELWTSDGTPGSERRVRDLCPGPCGSQPDHFMDLGGVMLFTTRMGGQEQLWRSNGSRRGTEPVATLCPALASPTSVCLFNEHRLGPLAFFSVAGATWNESEPWLSDGTPGGTRRLREVVPDLPPQLNLLGTAGGFVYFQTPDALWRTDGTAQGTLRLKAFSELTGVSTLVPGEMAGVRARAAWKGDFYAVVGDGMLIRSDGTTEGTVALRQVDGYGTFVAVGEWLLVVPLVDGSMQSIWRTQGTTATTSLLRRFGDGFHGRSIEDIVSLGDHAVLQVFSWDAAGTELWETDGTPDGTRQFLTLPNDVDTGSLASTGSQALFTLDSRDVGYASNELWRTDGTAAGTRLVRDFRDLPGSGGPIRQVEHAGDLLFVARTGELDAPLFRSDGTTAGTFPLSDDAQWGWGFTLFNGRTLFASATGYSLSGDYLYTTPNGLWETDGIPGGTRKISRDIGNFSPLAALGGQLLFAGGHDSGYYQIASDIELWSLGGGRPSLVKNINPYEIIGWKHNCEPLSSYPGPAVTLGDRMIFAADDGLDFGRELWVSDGTRDGTTILRDIRPETVPTEDDGCNDDFDFPLSSEPQDLVRVRHGVVFTADDGVTGRELWWTDGTSAGTRRVRDLRQGPEGSQPRNLTAFRGAVYFLASVDGVGDALWRTDGTRAGTAVVDDLKIGGWPSWAGSLTPAGGQLFLAVYNERTGAELWASGGDAASTRLVVDLRPGPAGSYPQQLTNTGGVLTFAATDGQTGLEPWRSDGTAAGTYRLGDVNPGPGASSPGPFTRAGGSVFFGAWEPRHGRELWAVPAGGPPLGPAEFEGAPYLLYRFHDSPLNILTATVDWEALLADTAWND